MIYISTCYRVGYQVMYKVSHQMMYSSPPPSLVVVVTHAQPARPMLWTPQSARRWRRTSARLSTAMLAAACPAACANRAVADSLLPGGHGVPLLLPSRSGKVTRPAATTSACVLSQVPIFSSGRPPACHKVRNQVRPEVRYQVRYQMMYPVRHQVRYQVKHQVMCEAPSVEPSMEPSLP